MSSKVIAESTVAAAAIVLAPKAQKTIAKSTTPPPRKSEIIEALAQRKISQLAKEMQDRRTRLDELSVILEKAVLRVAEEKLADKPAVKMLALKTSGNCLPWESEEWDGDTTVKVWKPAAIQLIPVIVAHQDLTPAERKLLDEYYRLQKQWRNDRAHGLPSLAEVKRQVRAAYEGVSPAMPSRRESRVDQLLTDPEASKALDKLLAALDKRAAENQPKQLTS